jgi:hypothetical protein
MIYQPMTEEQAEEAWVAAFMALISSRTEEEDAALYAYMQHLKREYHVIPAVYA